MTTQSSKNNSGTRYAAERMQHLLHSTADDVALQFIFAAELQAQSELYQQKKAAETPAADAPADATTAMPPPMAQRPQRPQRPATSGAAQRKITTTQTWRSDEKSEAEQARMPALLPEDWGWEEVQWLDFQESTETIAIAELAEQLFQLVYEQGKRLVDSVTDDGRQTPAEPIDQALVGALADAMREIVPAAGLKKKALALLKEQNADSPLYAEKVDAICAELFLENTAELPQGVSPDSIHSFLRLVLALARRRYSFLATEGRLAADKMARIEKEKEYKRYLLQDFKARVMAAICPQPPDGDDEDDEMPEPDFTYDEQQLLEHFTRLVQELLDASMLAARQVARGALSHVKEIDARISAAAEKWTLMRLDRVDRCLLRLGTYQLIYAEEKLPPALVINTAVEAAKFFGEQKSPAFVNGVLDKIRKDSNNEPITFGDAGKE